VDLKSGQYAPVSRQLESRIHIHKEHAIVRGLPGYGEVPEMGIMRRNVRFKEIMGEKIYYMVTRLSGSCTVM
jgi:hypothetical protein